MAAVRFALLIFSVLCLEVKSADREICEDLQLGRTTFEDLTEALKSERVDLAFILDISGSISNEDFRKIKLFLEDLLLFASVRCQLHINPETTRVSIFLFDDGAIAHKKSSNEKITGCEFKHLLSTLEKTQRNGGTLISNATREVIRLFQKWSRESEGARQILFIASDGEFEDSKYELELAGESLKAHEVDVYVVGVGQYLNTKSESDNLKKLSKTEGHTACIETWRLALVPDKEHFKPSAASWLEIPRANKATCDASAGDARHCDAKSVCACDASWPKYDCACQEEYFLDDATQLCTRCPDDTRKLVIGNDKSLCEPEHDEHYEDDHFNWLLILIVLVVVVVLVCFLALLFCCCTRKGYIHCVCVKKYYSGSNAERAETVTSSQALPPPYTVTTSQVTLPSVSVTVPVEAAPPIPPRVHMRQMSTEGEDNYYNRFSDYMSLICQDHDLHYMSLIDPDTCSVISSSGAGSSQSAGLATSAPAISLSGAEAEAVRSALIGGKKGGKLNVSNSQFRIIDVQRNDFVLAEEMQRSTKEKELRRLGAVVLSYGILMAIAPASTSKVMMEVLRGFAMKP